MIRPLLNPGVATLALLSVLLCTLLLGAGAEAGIAEARRAGSLRVMSFNIRFGTADDGANSWPHRRELLFETVRAADADIIGLQEALGFQVREISDAVPGYSSFGVGRDDGAEKGERCTILYRADRLELKENGTFWLSPEPETPGSVGWGNQITRICTWGRFVDRTGGGSFYVYNTHFDHQSQPSRERAAELIASRIAGRERSEDPVILMGDFNVGERNPVWLYLTGASARAITPEEPSGSAPADRDPQDPAPPSPELRDTFRVLHPDAAPVGTFNAFRGAADGEKIDAIFIGDGSAWGNGSPRDGGEGDRKHARGWDVLEAEIVRTNASGRYPSDHFPVTATIMPRPARGGDATPR